MDLMDTAQLLGNFGEFVGAIAVVATLGYLALQIRQNTRRTEESTASQEATTYQSLMSQIIELNRGLAADQQLGEIVAKARNGEVLDDSERPRYVSLITAILRYGDMAYYQYEKGLIDERRLHSAFSPVRGFLSGQEPAMQVFQRLARMGAFVEEFVVYCRLEVAAASPEHLFDD